MIDCDMVRSLLHHQTFVACRDRLTAQLFAEDYRDLYSIMGKAHDKYGHDLQPRDLLELWKAANPVATRAQVGEVRDLIDDLEHAKELSSGVVEDAITGLWQRHTGKTMATLALEVAEGNNDAMQRLKELVDRVGDGFVADDFGQETTQDLDELLALMTDEDRWKFNIETLMRHVTGLAGGDLGILFATPETGKTAFITSICCAPGGFVDQGAKVLILGNEESTKRTVVRAYSCVTGFTKDEILSDREKAAAIYKGRTQGRLIFQDIQGWTLQKVEAFIAKHNADIVVIDQLDKVSVTGNFEKGYERLGEIYKESREIAKRQNCAVIGVSQASNEATGKTRITYDMLAGSKINKAAEADLIIGIGKLPQTSDEDTDPSRYLTISKNKITGYHGTIVTQIQPELSRYVE